MNTITQYINTAGIQEFIALSVCNSLIIGLILAFVIFGIENSKRKISHQNIYQFYKIGLFVLILSPIILALGFQKNVIEASQISLLNRISDQWDKYLFMFWSTGVTIYLLALIITEYYINRLIQGSSNLFPEEWSVMIENTRHKLNYFKKLNILHHDKVNSAFLSGVIKPVLLLPTSWINQISIQEAEFILLHELSHLKMKDHYINAMCTMAEVLYFFNPIVHLFIRRIRFQRELCVDELVISYTEQPLQYANCLIKIGEKSIHQRSVNFSSIKNQLSFRIKNILNLELDKQEKNKTLRFSSLICLGLMSLVYFTSSPKNEIQNVSNMEICNEPMNCENITSDKIELSKVQKPANQIKKHKKQVQNEILEPVSNKEEIVFERNNLIDKIKDAIAAESSMSIKNSDSASFVIVLEQPQSYYSTGQRMMIVNRKYLYEKDWKYKMQDNKKAYRYIIINEGGKTILSYNQNLQSINHLSNIN